jgi:regulator of sigma E protease
MAVIIFLIILSALVLIHEAGHFFAARIFKIKADEFGYGFPPRLIGYVKDNGRWKKVSSRDRTHYKNTIWSINWLPLGGFVRIKGEQADGVDDKDSFHSHPIWQRVIVLAAGVGMNWLLAFVLLSTVFMLGTNAVLEDLPAGAIVKDRAVRITEVLQGSPADKAGLKPNDVIISVDGQVPATFEDARNEIAARDSQPVTIVISRDHKEQTITVTPIFIQEVGRVALGVGLADVGHVSFPPLSAIKVGALATFGYTRAVLTTFIDIFRDLFAGRPVAQQVSGPVGIAVVTGQIAQQGIVALMQFAAILSINLAVINFLPIPALDGGRVLFLAIEKLRRKAMSRTVEAMVHNIAFLILLGLIVLITIRDITRLVKA